MRRLISSKWLPLIALAFLAAGCGGGGSGGGDSGTTTPSSEWGTMNWDEGQWS